MLRLAVVFLVVALVAAVLGFSTIAGDAAEIAKVIFFIFVVMFFVSLVLSFGRRPAV